MAAGVDLGTDELAVPDTEARAALAIAGGIRAAAAANVFHLDGADPRGMDAGDAALIWVAARGRPLLRARPKSPQ